MSVQSSNSISRVSRPRQASQASQASHVFRPGLSAAQVDRELKRAVQNWNSAEQCVVLWFAELHRRRLYKKLGYGDIHLYATEVLGFSRARSYQFLKLAERLQELPTLRKAVASGELGWTKARAVATVATAKTQKGWLEKARTSSRRELEREIDRTKRRVRAARESSPSQMALGAVGSDGTEGSAGIVGSSHAGNTNAAGRTSSQAKGDLRASAGVGSTEQNPGSVEAGSSRGETITETPLNLNVSFTPEQLARYEALVAQLRRRGHHETKGELLLVALDSLLTNSEPGTTHRADGSVSKRGGGRSAVDSDSKPTGGRSADGFPSKKGKPKSRTEREGRERTRADGGSPMTKSPYQILIHHCPRCESAEIATSRGDQAIGRATLEAALCDARLKRPGERTRSTLPPRLRRQALERDRHRCRMPGCEQRHFLAVHHIVPRQDGGTHELSNLITLCGSCHRALHELRATQRQEVLGPLRRKGGRITRRVRE